MWNRLRNFFLGLSTYGVLSPDLKVRQQVNRRLHERPALQLEEWVETFWRPCGVSQSLAEFIYFTLAQSSGLEFARVTPGDRLEADLHWTLVCWFDWDLHLCEAFYQRFGLDLSDRFDAANFETIADLVLFFQTHLLAVNSSPTND